MSTPQTAPVLQRTSFNVQARYLQNRSGLVNFVRRGKPSTITVMDDDASFSLSWELQQASPSTMIISRRYSDDESSYWQTMTPLDYVNKIVKPNLFPGGAYHILCEPAPQGEQLVKCLRWLCDVMRIMAEMGLKGVVGNFQTVVYDWASISSGVWDEYLFTLAKYDGLMWGGWHEYAVVDFTSNVMGKDPYRLLNPQSWDPLFSHYPTPREISEYTGIHWHIFRYILWNRYCETRDAGPIPIHRKVLTEIGYDHINDLDVLLQRLEDKYHRYISGINTLGNIWSDLYPGLNRQWVAFQQTRWLENCMTPDVRGWNNYAMSNKSDWLEYDYQLWDTYMEYMCDPKYLFPGIPTWRKTAKWPDNMVWSILPQFPDGHVPPVIEPPVEEPPIDPIPVPVDWEKLYKDLVRVLQPLVMGAYAASKALRDVELLWIPQEDKSEED